MANVLLQIAIAAFTCTAMFLVSKPGPRQKWGFAIGLVGQPLWIYTTAAAEQWGMFAVSLFVTWTWYRGVKEHLA